MLYLSGNDDNLTEKILKVNVFIRYIKLFQEICRQEIGYTFIKQYYRPDIPSMFLKQTQCL